MVAAARIQPNLQMLRSQIGAIDGSAKSESFSSQWVPGNIPRGSLIEIIGSGRTELMVRLLSEQQKVTTAPALWVESDFSAYPIGFTQNGIDLSRLLFVECEREAAWVLGQALQAQIFPIVVVADLTFHEKEMRRFQLLSERARATTFLLAAERRPSWVPQMVIAASAMNVEIIRKRGAQ